MYTPGLDRKNSTYVQLRWGGKRKGKSLGADGKKVFVAQVNRTKVYEPVVDGNRVHVAKLWMVGSCM